MKFKSIVSNFTCYSLATWNQKQCFEISTQHQHNKQQVFVNQQYLTCATLHLDNLKSLPTISFYATLTLLDFSRKWFQGFALAQPEIFAENIILHCTCTIWFSLHLYILISGFYTCTTRNLRRRYHCTVHLLNLTVTTFVTWYHSSALAQSEIFIFIVKLHIWHYSLANWFSLHSQNIQSLASLFCVYVFLHIHISYSLAQSHFHYIRTTWYQVFSNCGNYLWWNFQ